MLCGVSLRVEPRQIVTVAGTNGSGKSTMGKAIMGLLPRWSGSIAFEGHDLRRVAAHRRIGLGLFYVPQTANVFPSLTVLENLQVVGVKGAGDRIDEVLRRFPSLDERAATAAGALSGGERQQLAIARAIVSGARLMIMDEPTANLAPAIVEQVLDLIHGLPALGVAVLLIEQRAREALAVSDVGYVMHLGEIVAHDIAPALLRDARLGELFFGQGATRAATTLDSRAAANSSTSTHG
ncbi:MAG: ABC transporter ATP-binding protein [Actinomycetota bacterium]